MYFLSKKLSKTYLIGIYQDYLYAYGQIDEDKLIIFRKALIDADGWQVFSETNISILRSTCDCGDGYAVATGIHGSSIYLFVNDLESNFYMFALCLKSSAMELLASDTDHKVPLQCSNCFGVSMRNFSADQLPNDDFLHYTFTLLATSGVVEETIPVAYNLVVNSSLQKITSSTPFYFTSKTPEFSNKEMNANGDILHISGRNGRQFIFALDTEISTGITTTSKDWKEVAFFLFDEKLCYLAREDLDDGSTRMDAYSFSATQNREYSKMERIKNLSFTVDSEFPSFGCAQVFTAPNLFVFSTPFGIVTVINRMLSLAEVSYLSMAKKKYTEVTAIYGEKKWISVKAAKKALGFAEEWPLLVSHQ